MVILPSELILNSSERAEVQGHIHELAHFTRLDQPITIREVTMTNDQAMATMIAGLLLKGGRKMDKQSSDAATEDYLDAIEDVPAWSVREAIRKWNRGESVALDPKKPHDFNWRPEPPTLRRLALYEVAGVKGRILSLQKLLDAAPLVEYSEEYRADMLLRLQALFQEIGKPKEMPPADLPADHGAREGV